jgi:sulfonate transport system ATP-binding protein
MNMQDEILNIWRREKMTIVMVTHDVDEAIYMAGRIVVMSARPAKIENVIPVEIGRPRRRDDPDFLSLRTKILRILHFAGTGAEPEYQL